MVNTQSFVLLVALSLAGFVPRVLTHGDDEGEGNTMSVTAATMSTSSAMPSASLVATPNSPESYFAYPKFGGLMLAHIALMTVAWLFVLPIGPYLVQNERKMPLTLFGQVLCSV